MVSSATLACSYAAFALVGLSTGWLTCNALYNLLANEPEVQQSGAMFGTFSMAAGTMGIIVSLLHWSYLHVAPASYLEVEQRRTTVLCILTVSGLLSLSAFWRLGAPEYPVVVAGCWLGQFIGYASICWVLPMVSTRYGGWLVAAVRLGTDLSGIVGTWAAELQNPSGSNNRFSTRYLLLFYVALATLGLITWAFIVRSGTGLRRHVDLRDGIGDGLSEDPDDTCSNTADENSDKTGDGSLSAQTGLVTENLPVGHYAPGLGAPVALASLAQVLQWSLSMSLGPIGAKMTDPDACDGKVGAWVFRQSVTLSHTLVPTGSAISSLGWCPRWLFFLLSAVQVVSTSMVCAAAFGVGRSFWTEAAGRFTFIVAFSLIAGLEGYLLTMTYRYIGDTAGLSQDARRNTSNTLGVIGNLCTSALSLLVGKLLQSGSIKCTPIESQG